MGLIIRSRFMSVKGIVNMVVLCAWLSWTQIPKSKMNYKYDWLCAWLPDSRTQTPVRDALLNQELSKQRWQESKLDGINNQISIHVSKMNCKHDWSCAWLSDSRTQTPTRDPLINQELSKQRRQEHKLTGINNKIFPISLTTKACNRV